jgi:CRISPR-associated protein Cas5 subtype I-B
MKGLVFELWGTYGHFKKPETNNNPLTFDFITKSALLGLIGANLGIERNEMKKLYPKLSRSFGYNLRLINPVKKESIGHIWRKDISNESDKRNFNKKSTSEEYLKNPQSSFKKQQKSANFSKTKKLIK